MYQPGEEYSALSAADLSNKQYYISKLDASGKVVLATAATENLLGVIHDGGRVSGDTVSVQLINGTGTFKVVAGATFSAGAYLTTDSNGKAIATTTTGDRVFGRAVRACTNAGQIVEYVKYNEKY